MTRPKIQAAVKMQGIEHMPLSKIQWLPREALHANNYNPNHVAPNELELLKVSLLEDGWTQPIVARTDNEIVDGYHRWTLAADPEIAEMTGGLVPVVYLRADLPMEHQMMSTVHHNRARGAHAVLKMADIVYDLLHREGLTYEEVMQRLGMEWEEVERLADRGGMTKRASKATFNQGWVPD